MTKNKQGGLTAPIKTKNMKFNISNITMKHRPAGGYFIHGMVNGISVTATTNDSEIYDWYNDDTDLELNNSALLHCEWKLEEQYLSL